MTSKRLTYAGLLIAVVGCGGNDTFGTRDIASGESTTSGLKWITGFGGSQSQAYGVSSTGAVVVGWAANSASQYRAFRWTATSMC